MWQLRGRTAVTSELASLLDGRIDQLPDDVLHAAAAADLLRAPGPDTLTSLVGSDAVEDAETRGLIRVVAEHHSVDVRFNHPLFGELIRRRLGMAARAAAARRTRSRVTRASPCARRASGSGWRS